MLLRRHLLIVACCLYSLKKHAKNISSFKGKDKDVKHLFVRVLVICMLLPSEEYLLRSFIFQSGYSLFAIELSEFLIYFGY